jgi:hypothetical protein
VKEKYKTRVTKITLCIYIWASGNPGLAK